MPDHIKLVLRHGAIGGGLSAAFVGLLLWFDVAHLRHLVSQTADGALALGVLFVLCWITFGSVQIGVRIMMMGAEGRDDDDHDDDDHDDDWGHGGGGRRAPEPRAIPVPVRRGTERQRRGPAR